MAEYFGFDAYDVEQGRDPFVFISYKSEDCDRVAPYARYIHDHGVNVWYDNGLHAGVDWESYLMTVIEKPNCKAVLLFVSGEVAHSTVIPLETTQARACKKPTVAVYLEPGLDLEVLLSKAIKVYVEQRQSVDAFAGSREEICVKVLEAAKRAMENASYDGNSGADELWKNARMFLLNARRSRSEKDVNKARVYLEQLTERYPADYRGWLGLAMSECLCVPESLDDAGRQLRECARYYSYVVAAGADEYGSAEYTEVKSMLWEQTIELIRSELASCGSSLEAAALSETATELGNRLGHTLPHIRSMHKALSDSASQTAVMFERQEKERSASEAEEKAEDQREEREREQLRRKEEARREDRGAVEKKKQEERIKETEERIRENKTQEIKSGLKRAAGALAILAAVLLVAVIPSMCV